MGQAREMGLEGRVGLSRVQSLWVKNSLLITKKADIYVIASRSSEGFPRTIWEAMAHCLPVVATKVGSIPAFIEGAAVAGGARKPGKTGKMVSSSLIDEPVTTAKR